MKPLVLGLSLLALLATGLLAQADPQTQFFSLVGSFVVSVLVVAVAITMVIAIVFLALFNTLGRGVIDRRFSLFMAWNLLRSHKRREPLTFRLYRRVKSLSERPTAARLRDAALAVAAGLAFWATTANGVYNTLAIGHSPTFAVTVQVVLAAIAILFTLRAVPPTSLVPPFVIRFFKGLFDALNRGLKGLNRLFRRMLKLGKPPTEPAERTLASRLWNGGFALATLIALWATTWDGVFVAAVQYNPASIMTVMKVRTVLVFLAAFFIVRAFPLSSFAGAFQARLTLQPFVSIVGVSLGIWALIVVLSVMRGFADDLQTKILRTNAHIIVEPANAAGVLGDTYKLTDSIKTVDGIKEVMPVAYGEVMMSSSTSIAVNVVLKGLSDADLRGTEQLQGAVTPGDVRWLSEPQALLSDRYRFPLQLDNPRYDREPKDDGDKSKDGEPSGDGEPKGGEPKGDGEPKGGEPKGDGDEPNGDGEKDDDGEPKTAPLKRNAASDALPETVEDDANFIKTVDTTDPFGTMAPNPRVYPGILLGSELGRSLNVSVGSELQVISPDGDYGPTGLRPKLKTFRVAGIFTTGMYEYDQKLAYMALDDAQRFLNLDGNLNRLEVRLVDPETTDRVIAELDPILASHGGGDAAGLRTMGWRERNKSLFAALALERIAMFIILALTIIVAALSILSALTMIVVQRSKDIAVLKALGASNGTISRTFLGIGAMIGLIATGTGLVIGLGFTVTIKHFGLPLPKEYYISTLPVAIEPMEVIAVALIAMGICMAATWYPARTASRLSPVEGFRHG